MRMNLFEAGCLVDGRGEQILLSRYVSERSDEG